MKKLFRKENLKGIDISSSLCNIKLQSPFILSSGPLSYSAEGLIRAHRAGCGAVVTKTIRLEAAVNPVNHISAIGNDSLINCEKWADTDRLRWYEREIPTAKKAGAVVIASTGHTLEEVQAIARDLELSGADIIELVSYAEDALLPMLDFAKNTVNIPVICKLSANWPDAAGTASKCLEHGADGICAIDSIGPALKIDINRARPSLMGSCGLGWLSGAAIKPVSLRINYEIARRNPGFKNLYGTGGCMSAEDAIEFLMAGCSNAGVCTALILKGMDYIETMCYNLSSKLYQLGYNSLGEVIGAALPNFPPHEVISHLEFNYEPGTSSPNIHTVRCINCRRCITICPYGARHLEFPVMTVDQKLCRSCGACASVCPTGALTSRVAEQTVKDREREKAAFGGKCYGCDN